MEKKVWKTPEMWNLNVENTEHGGNDPKKHDGYWIQVEGLAYEGVS